MIEMKTGLVVVFDLFFRQISGLHSVIKCNTVILQWLAHLWNHGNMFETGIVRANEC